MRRAINYRELSHRFQLDGAQKTVKHLREAIQDKHLAPEDFSVKELAESLVEDGREWVRNMDPRKSGGFMTIQEESAVNTTAFSNVIGQLIYSKILDAYENEQFVFTAMVPNISTKLDGEKIPGLSRIGDEAEIVEESQQYPTAGFGEDYIETPRGVKRGLIVPVTKEAIFFDRTGIILKNAGEVGEFLGLNKEKRLIDCYIDENSTAHRYKWKGTSYASYQATSPWINLKSSNQLVDWTDLDAAEQLFNNMVDPHTGEPIMLTAMQLTCTPQLRPTAMRVLNATEVRETTNTNTVTIGPTPVQTNYQVVSSRLLAARMATDTSWFLGDIAKTIAYMEQWPLTVAQAPVNSEAEFQRDIVAQFKASERGAAVVMNPRYTVKSTVA